MTGIVDEYPPFRFDAGGADLAAHTAALQGPDTPEVPAARDLWPWARLPPKRTIGT
jgi:hypothetical protein